jgi:glycosyltransferase involved in cell wall biosynthesis
MNRDLSIAYLVQQFLPEIGAGPARVSELSRRWSDTGAQVTVVTGLPNRPHGIIPPEYRGHLFVEEDWQGIRVLRSWLYASPKSSFFRTVLNNFSFALTATMHASLKLTGADVLIASSPPFFPHVSGAFLKRVRNVPLVLELRDLWPDYLADMGLVSGLALDLLFRLERWLLQDADEVVVVTRSFRQKLIEKGVTPERIHVFPNAVDPDLYYREEVTPPVPELVRADGDFLVGYLGNFGRSQGLESVVEAAAILAEKDSSVRIVLTGDGPQRESVELAAQRVPGGLVTVRGPIPKNQTRAYYNCLDACLVPLAPFPTVQETIPSKLFEIMACETPVVASLGGEGRRVVQESDSGVVSDPGSPASIAEGILQIRRARPEERARMGARGRAYVLQHFSRDVIAKEYHELLVSVVKRERLSVSNEAVIGT